MRAFKKVEPLVLTGDELLARRFSTMTKKKIVREKVVRERLRTQSVLDSSSYSKTNSTREGNEPISNSALQRDRSATNVEIPPGEDILLRRRDTTDNGAFAIDNIAPDMSVDGSAKTDMPLSSTWTNDSARNVADLPQPLDGDPALQTSGSKHQLPTDILRKAKVLSLIQNTEIYVSYWDLGGDEPYYATHHMHLSSDAVYILVFDVSQMEIEEEKRKQMGEENYDDQCFRYHIFVILYMKENIFSKAKLIRYIPMETAAIFFSEFLSETVY